MINSLLRFISLDQGIVGIFFALSLIIGFFSARKVKSFRDYAIANKNYDVLVITISLIATMVGGSSIVGTAAEIFDIGLLYAVASCGFIVGIFILAIYIAPNFDGRFDKMVSSSDIIRKYYGRNAEKFSAVICCIQCLVTTSFQIITLGYLAKTFLQLEYQQGVLIIGLIIVFYSTMGGIKAVTMTDIFQFIILIAVMPILANFAVLKAGGLFHILQVLPREKITFIEHKSFVRHLLLFIFWSMPFTLLYPAIVQRFLMLKQIQDRASISYMYGLFKVILLFFLIAIAFSSIILFPHVKPKTIIPNLINILPQGLSGLIVAGMFAVTMSTADSFLNTAAILLTKNLRYSKKLSKLVLVKVNTFILGCFALSLALLDYNMISLSVTMNALVYFSMGIPLFFVIMRKYLNRNVYWLSVVVSISTMVVGIYIFGIGYEASFMVMCACIFVHLFFYVKKKGSFSFFLKKLNIVDYAKRLYNTCNLKRFHINYSFFEIFEEINSFYKTFAIFFCAFYIAPFFLWATNLNRFDVIVIRVLGGIFPLGLLLKVHMHTNFQKKLFVLYWFFTLIFCLPFLATIVFFSEQESLIRGINLILSVFLLSLIVDWTKFVWITILGTLCGCLYIELFFPADFSISRKYLGFILYATFISVLIGMIFGRIKENVTLDKIKTIKAFGGQIAHEARVPIGHLSFSLGIIKKAFLSARVIKKKKEYLLRIKGKEFNSIKRMLDGYTRHVETGRLMINNLLTSIKTGLFNSNKHFNSFYEILNDILAGEMLEYKDKISLSKSDGVKDIKFYGSKEYMSHCIYNIIKNAEQHALYKKGAYLKINIYKNQVVFEDNGVGIDKKELNKIFNKFYSSHKEGSGLGLSFCKDFMEEIGGKIVCKSQLGKGAKFILIFP